MTSMSSGYTEEYLKMKDDSSNDGENGDGAVNIEMDERNNNSASVIAASGTAVSLPITGMIPVDGHVPAVEMIVMQNLAHLQHQNNNHEHADHLTSMHYDNLDQVVNSNGTTNGTVKHLTNHLSHHNSHQHHNHHLANQPMLQQTVL